MFNQPVQTENIVPLGLTLFESGTYGDQFLRGIGTEVNGNTVNRISELMIQSGNKLAPGMLNSIAGSIVTPMSQVEGLAGIDLGWQEKRFRWRLELKIENRFGGFVFRKVLTGWTNHLGMSDLNGNPVFDPNMMFYINNDLSLRDRQTTAANGLGLQTVTERIASDQILLGSWEKFSHNNPLSLRPEDVTSQLASGGNIMEMSGASVSNFYAQFMASPVKASSRRNNSPTHWLGKILRSYQSAADAYGNDSMMVDGIDETLANATGLAKDGVLHENSFIMKLKEVSDYMDQGFFTYGQLCALFPEIGMMTNCRMYGGGSNILVQPPMAGDSARMDNSDMTTMTMQKLMNSLPALMSDCLLDSCGFIFTNEQAGCADSLTPIAPEFFAPAVKGLHPQQLAMDFINKFLIELAPILTHQGQVALTIRFISNLYGNTEITINYAGSGEYKYNLPTFADTLTSPMVTRDGRKLSQIGMDIQNLMSAVADTGVLDANTLTFSQMVQGQQPMSAGSLFGGGAPVSFPNAGSGASSDETTTLLF